jgi:methylmalonyl-CoA epimerase
MPGVWFDHIGIACESNEESEKFWSLLGFYETGQEENVQQGVKIRFMQGKDAPQPRLELLEPITEDTPVGRFISKRGAGVQQVALATDDLTGLLEILNSNNIRLINEEPMQGAGGAMISFIHPSSTGGVLVELVQKEP